MNLKTVLGGFVVAVLFFFGIIFALASVYESTRLIVAAMLFVVGFGIAYYITRKPKVMVQKAAWSIYLKASNDSARVGALKTILEALEIHRDIVQTRDIIDRLGKLEESVQEQKVQRAWEFIALKASRKY